MGCPDKSIEKQGAGAAHMKNPAQARLVIQAALKGVHNKIPVSVKTRLGYNTFEYETWLPEILKENISALTVHLRTRKEMSKVPAHWEVVPDLVRIVRTKRPDITLLCNGDVTSLEEAHKKINQYGIDGVMLGRAIFGNPWLFAENALPTHHERVQALLKLTEYFGQLRPAKHMAILKKHIKAFIKGDHDDAGLRKKLYDCITLEDLSQAVKDALQ